MIGYKSSDPILNAHENTTMGIDLLRAEQVTEARPYLYAF